MHLFHHYIGFNLYSNRSNRLWLVNSFVLNVQAKNQKITYFTKRNINTC